MKKIVLGFILFFATYTTNADNYPVGASSLATGGSTVAVQNLWSVYHNQAALGFFEGIEAGIYYENRFMLPEYGLKSMAFAMNLKPGTIGLSVSSFGFNKFSDNKIGLAYGMKLSDFIAIGIQIDYFLIQQDAYYGNISTVSGEIGIYATPFEDFYIGAHVFNPWRSKIANYQDERLPTIFRLGIAYNFSEEVLFSLETEKDLDFPAVFKTGLEYEPIKNFILRTGVSFSNKDFFPAFGIGYNFKGIGIDLSFESHPILGTKTGVSLSYKIK
ncbi:MAG: hypothetical protein JXR68_09695 [Bacteroidales bacterium]|nr:hypothetical protein [Bacteroidales bacterium]